MSYENLESPDSFECKYTAFFGFTVGASLYSKGNIYKELFIHSILNKKGRWKTAPSSFSREVEGRYQQPQFTYLVAFKHTTFKCLLAL